MTFDPFNVRGVARSNGTTHLQPMTREQRRQDLERASRARLVLFHHRHGGCLMDVTELSSWSKEEIITAILDHEYGPRVTADPQEAPGA